MPRGRISNLRKSEKKAFNKVASTRGGMKCGRSSRGPKREVCLAVAPVVGWSCGYNPVNKLYACAAPGPRSVKKAGRARARRGRGKKRR